MYVPRDHSIIIREIIHKPSLYNFYANTKSGRRWKLTFRSYRDMTRFHSFFRGINSYNWKRSGKNTHTLFSAHIESEYVASGGKVNRIKKLDSLDQFFEIIGFNYKRKKYE